MNRRARLAAIAKKHLGIGTLTTRKSDSLDFHDLAVWTIQEALAAAYDAGRADERASARSGPVVTGGYSEQHTPAPKKKRLSAPAAPELAKLLEYPDADLTEEQVAFVRDSLRRW